jgi:DNA-binding HxlR family transcriptional regulator
VSEDDASDWCDDIDELRELIDLLNRPAVLPVLDVLDDEARTLAQLRAAVVGGARGGATGAVGATEQDLWRALHELKAFRLIHATGPTVEQLRFTLTDSARALRDPLGLLAQWHRATAHGEPPPADRNDPHHAETTRSGGDPDSSDR